VTISARLRSFLVTGLVAPIVGGVWGGVFFSIMMAAVGDAYRWPPTFLLIMGITSAYGAAVALVLTWTLGLAWHVLACVKGWRSGSAYVAFGAAAGAAIALALLFIGNPTWTPAMLLGILWLSSTGGLIALTGWLIRRPDRDRANPATSPS
jgi:hypothetical protein